MFCLNTLTSKGDETARVDITNIIVNKNTQVTKTTIGSQISGNTYTGTGSCLGTTLTKTSSFLDVDTFMRITGYSIDNINQAMLNSLALISDDIRDTYISIGELRATIPCVFVSRRTTYINVSDYINLIQLVRALPTTDTIIISNMSVELTVLYTANAYMTDITGDTVANYAYIFPVLRTLIGIYSPNPPIGTHAHDLLYMDLTLSLNEYFNTGRVFSPFPTYRESVTVNGQGVPVKNDSKRTTSLTTLGKLVISYYFSSANGSLNPRMVGWGTLILPIAAMTTSDTADLTFPYESVSLDNQRNGGSKVERRIGYIYPDINITNFGYLIVGTAPIEMEMMDTSTICVIQLDVSIASTFSITDIKQYLLKLRTKLCTSTDRAYTVSLSTAGLNLNTTSFTLLMNAPLTSVKVNMYQSLNNVQIRSYFRTPV